MPASTSPTGKPWPRDVIAYIFRQDPGLQDLPEGDALPVTGWVRIRGEEPYLDGPVTPRVAVVDLDVKSGTMRPGAKFIHGVKGRKDGWYEVPQLPDTADFAGPDPDSDPFLQVSVWGTVLDAIRWFERPEILGRPVRWAFEAPQLLVVPRAGEMANAFYDRDSHSLQFFSFPAADGSGRTIHTAMSRDVVVHETAHAILDGIAPSLLGAITPQARAIHESIADLAATFASLGDKTQIFDEMTFRGRDLRAPTAFSRLAEQLGAAVHRDIGADALREANNDSTLDPTDRTSDGLGRLNYVDDVTDTHVLSSVLTGAVFRVFLELAAALDAALSWDDILDDSRMERNVMTAAERVARMVFRALDYLPPGELSFADVGRAVIAADRVIQPRSRKERDWLVDELTRRRVVDDREELFVDTDLDEPRVRTVDVRRLERDDGFARSFVAANRGLLRIPARARFTVHPRLRSPHRSAGSRTKRRHPGDLLVKVSWSVEEDNPLGPRFPARRTVQMGTTLVVDVATRRVHAVLTTENGDPSRHRPDRQAYLERLVGEGRLRPRGAALGPDGRPLAGVMEAAAVGGAMRLTGGERKLRAVPPPRCGT